MAVKILKGTKKPNTSKIAPRTPKKKLQEGYKCYQGLETIDALTLKHLVAFNISTYQKIKMLMISSVESGKPSEQKKMLGFLRGFQQVKDNPKLTNELLKLDKIYHFYVQGGAHEPVLACFKKTDEYIESLKK